MTLTTRELQEVLTTLDQFESIMTGKLKLIPTKEVTDRVLRGINASKLKIQKELKI